MGEWRQRAWRRRWRWLAGLSVLALLVGVLAWRTWPTPPAPPLPDEPANAAAVLATIRQEIAAGYVTALNADIVIDGLLLPDLQPLAAALHEYYPESTRRWLLRHLLGPGRPAVDGISDYDLSFLAPMLVTSESLRQTVLAELVLPQVAAPSQDWRGLTLLQLGLQLQCEDPQFLRLAFEACFELDRAKQRQRRLSDLLRELDQELDAARRRLSGNRLGSRMPLLSANHLRRHTWLAGSVRYLPQGAILSHPAEFIAAWATTKHSNSGFTSLFGALKLSPADAQLVLTQVPEIAPYLRDGRAAMPVFSGNPPANARADEAVAELQARRPQMLAAWAQASTADEALAVMPALMLLDNHSEPWLAAFCQRWPGYYYQPTPDTPSWRRFGVALLFGGAVPMDSTPAELMAALHHYLQQHDRPPAYSTGYYSQAFLELFWQAERELLARAPEWQPLAQAWRDQAGRPWPPALLAEHWDAARQRLHAAPEAEAAQYAGLLLAPAWALSDPRAAERRFHPFWPAAFGGPAHRWCAAAIAADLLPENDHAGDPWVRLWRLSEGRPGLPTALVWEQLMTYQHSPGRFLELGDGKWLEELTADITHPALYGEQDWLDYRRWFAQQGIGHPWSLMRLARLRDRRPWWLLPHYLQHAKEAGLDADHPILPQPYYHLMPKL